MLVGDFYLLKTFPLHGRRWGDNRRLLGEQMAVSYFIPFLDYCHDVHDNSSITGPALSSGRCTDLNPCMIPPSTRRSEPCF